MVLLHRFFSLFRLSARNLPGKEGSGCHLEWEKGWGPHLVQRGDMEPSQEQQWEWQLQKYPQAPGLGFLGEQRLIMWIMMHRVGMSLENTWSDIALGPPCQAGNPPDLLEPHWDGTPHL